MIATLFHPLTLMLATLCLQWVILAQFGGAIVELRYVALAYVILFAATGSRRITASFLFVRHNLLWIVPFALYLLLLIVSTYGSPAQNMGLRQALYLLACVAFAGSLAAARNPAAILRTGSGLAILLFIILVEILARRAGMSWVDAVRAFWSGDLKFVVYSFFREIFNSLNPDDNMPHLASQKNGVAVCVLVCALLFRAASNRPWRDVVGMGHTAVVAVLLVLLSTRSVLIVGAASLLLAIGLRFMAGQSKNLLPLATKGMVTIAAAVAAFAISDPGPVGNMMADRFAFNDASAEARVVQVSVALERIADNPIIGGGYEEVEGYQVHNLFLNAWMNAGIGAFLLVVCFYLVLLGRWISFVWSIARDPEHWVLPLAPEWIAALPLLPLFRVWLSGDGGNLFFGEWVAVAAFLGLVLANDLKRSSASVIVAPRVLRPSRPAWSAKRASHAS